jgi:hypothetical protein
MSSEKDITISQQARRITELEKMVTDRNATIAQLNAAEFVHKYHPDGQIVAVLSNGLVTPASVYSVPYVQRLVAGALINDRARITRAMEDSRKRWDPIHVSLAQLEALRKSILWVAKASDGQRLDSALADLGQQLGSAYDGSEGFQVAVEALPEWQKQTEEIKWMVAFVDTRVQELKTGIRRVLGGTDRGDYLRNLADQSLAELSYTAEVAIGRRAPGDGETWLGNEGIRRKGESPDRTWQAITNDTYNDLTAKAEKGGQLSPDEQAGLEILTKIPHEKRGGRMKKWAHQRRLHINKQIARSE